MIDQKGKSSVGVLKVQRLKRNKVKKFDNDECLKLLFESILLNSNGRVKGTN